MKTYIVLGLRIIIFLGLVFALQSFCNLLFIDPLLKVPEIGDQYGLILATKTELSVFSLFFQLLGMLVLIAFFRMDAAEPFPFFSGSFREKARQVFWGGAAGAGLILAIAALICLPGLTGFSFTAFTGRELIVTLCLASLIALGEEIMGRGYILQELSEKMNQEMAVGISALIFAAMHFTTPDFTWLPILNLFLAGLLLGITYFRYNGIWAPVGLHFAWNFFQGPVLGFNVSGTSLPTWLTPEFSSAPAYINGSVYGLEGTVIAAMVQLAAIAWLYAGWKKKERGDPQPELAVEKGLDP